MSLDTLIQEALRAGAILGAAGIAVLLLRGSSAARRHFVWTLGVVAVLALPLLSTALPAWHVITLPQVRANSAASQAAELSSYGAGATSAQIGEPAMAAKIPVATEYGTSVAKSRPIAIQIDWALVVIAVWLGGALLVTASVLAGIAGARRLTKRASVCMDTRINERTGQLARQHGVTSRVRVLLAQDVMPITWGYARPVIILPHAALSWTDASLERVLRHELAHIRRHDGLTQLAAQLACALHWYNPLSWLAAHRLRVEREHACDDVLLTFGARASDYAEELITLARTFGLKPSHAMAAIAMANPASLRARLVALLDESRARSAVSRQFAVPSVVGVALVLLPLSMAAPARPSGGAMEVQEKPAPVADNVRPLQQSVRAPAPSATETSTETLPGTSLALSPEQQGVSCLTRPAKSRNTTVNNDDRKDTYLLKYSGSDCKGEVRLNGNLQYNADFTRITGLSRNGSLFIEEEDRGTRRRLEVEPSGSGLAYQWSVNGRERPFDAEARAWFDAWTLTLFRELGFAANERANAILAARGVNGVLSEVSQMSSDYVQASYLGAAVASGNPDAGEVARVLSAAEAELDSDYYLANVLTAASKGVTFNGPARQSFLAAVGRIDSDYYKQTVLTSLLANGRLNSAEVASVLQQGNLIDSDYYRATLLESVAGSYSLDRSLRSAYLAATEKIDSDYYRTGVLKTLLRQRGLGAADIADIISATRMVESDYYRSELLVHVAKNHALRGVARDAYTDVMNRIDSEYYRNTAAAALRSN